VAHILIVEDDSDFSAMLVHALTAERHEIRRVANAKEAVHVIDSNWPELLIADYFLLDPVMDGGDLARHLSGLRPQTPIIFVSAMPRAVLDREAQRLPKCRVIQKPIDLDVFLATVRAELASREADAPAQAAE
jgi:DNA-binding response OmpR family regulator